MEFPTGKYRCIVADPPWPIKRLESPGAKGFGTNTTTLRSVPLPYDTLTPVEIAALPVQQIAMPDAHLYLWTINRFVPDAYEIAKAWGFTPSTLLVWAKRPMGLGLGGAFSSTTEFVLFARKGALPFQKRIDSTWWTWSRKKHSEKPDAFYEIVRQVSPAPRIDLFNRRLIDGFDGWGDESPQQPIVAQTGLGLGFK